MEWLTVAQLPDKDQWLLTPTDLGFYLHGQYEGGGIVVDVEGNQHPLLKCWLPAPPPIIDCGVGGFTLPTADDDTDDTDDTDDSLFSGQINALKEVTDQLLVNAHDALRLTDTPPHSSFLGEFSDGDGGLLFDWATDNDLLFGDHIAGALTQDFVIPCMRSKEWQMVGTADELSLGTFERTKGSMTFRLVIFRNGTSLSMVSPSMIEFKPMSTLEDIERFIANFT